MATSIAVPLWRNRDFTLLWTSQVASTIGSRVTAVAYPLLVLLLTGSPALLVFALGMIPVAVATTLSRGMREISAADPAPDVP